jgi:hypothetical protein
MLQWTSRLLMTIPKRPNNQKVQGFTWLWYCVISSRLEPWCDSNGWHLCRGCDLIRLDAVGYTTKKKGTNCFFVEPEIWQLLAEQRDDVECHKTEILAELHEHYTLQKKISEHGLWVYDFALPMLCLQVPPCLFCSIL